MNIGSIFNLFSKLVAFFAISMLIPAIYSFIIKDGFFISFLLSFCVIIAPSILIWATTKKYKEDLQAKVIKFIGEIEDRIKEDYLRIYRYFRFLGLFDLPLIDKKTQSIVEKYIHESLGVLTNDVIRQEVLKMFNMPFPLNCFYRSQVKFKWVEILKEHFIKTNYELGLKKCLNKIDSIIN